MQKHTTKLLAIFLLFASMTLFFGCQDQQPVESNVGNLTGLHKISSLILPEGTTIASADLNLFYYGLQDHIVEIHNINVPWTESGVTWDSLVGNYGPTITTFSANYVSPDWKSVDITSIVQGWVNCEPNNGILLKNQDVIAGLIEWLSKENTFTGYGIEYAPYIHIELSTGETYDVAVSADTYIRSDQHTDNFGDEPLLYCGFLSVPDGPEKRTLLKFDIECTPTTGGCTLTPGYWQTHSIYGPAPYDDTWAQIGENTTFFLSGQSYYDVLWTSPGGNAYYILSFQYIAAELNFLNGADPTDAQDAFDDATDLFNTYTPAQIGALKGSDPLRQQFISLGTTLDNYNTGLIGPGHCDD